MPTLDSTPLTRLELKQVVAGCAEQTELFFAKKSSDDRFCFELWRRALVERVQQAWDVVYAQYQPLVVGWVQNHEGYVRCQEEVQFFVNESFARLYKAIAPEKFAKFSTLQGLLSYLNGCVHSAIIDHLRKRDPLPANLMIDNVAGHPVSIPSAHKHVLERTQREALWHLLEKRIKKTEEWVILECYFILGMKPNDIHTTHPNLFKDVKEVYRIKDNLLSRLQRDDELRQFLKDFTTDIE